MEKEVITAWTQIEYHISIACPCNSACPKSNVMKAKNKLVFIGLS